MTVSQKQRVHLITITIGLVVFLAVATLYPPDYSGLDSSFEETEVHLGASWVKRYAAGFVDSDYLKGIVEWELDIKYPNRIEKGSTISVRAIPNVVSVKPPEMRRDKVDIKTGSVKQVRVFDSAYVNRDLLKDLENGAVKATLHFPSGKVSPLTLDKFNLTNPSVWSLYLPVSGNHTGSVHMQVSDKGFFELPRPDDIEVDIEVYEPLFSTKNIFSFAGLVLGPLISIPGIFAFLRERRKDKEETEKAKKEESNIIIP